MKADPELTGAVENEEAIGDHAIARRLLDGGLAGSHRSHPRESNFHNAGRLASGDPDSTFGMPDVASATAEEALAAVAAVTGAREPGEAYIDPAATIAGVREAARRLGAACGAGATIVVVTGHPTGLLVHHVRLVEAIAAAGGRVIRPFDEVVLFHEHGAPRILKYFRGVGALTDGGNVLHTHSPAAMERILAGGAKPDLVFGDHGFAGAAVAAGIPTIAVMDTNDPALAVARARGRDMTIIPMDDNRRPDSYDVIAELFERELGVTGGHLQREVPEASW
jgi:hypothetical protein